MAKVVSARPVVIPYPRIESGSSSGKPSSSGTKLFRETYDSIQLIESVFLYAIDRNAFLFGALLGALKPVTDYHYKSVITKKGDYETNQEHFGQLVVIDQDMDDKVTDYNAKLRPGGKPTINDHSYIITYLTCKMIPVALAYITQGTVISRIITSGIGLKTGFTLTQKIVQWWGHVPQK